MKTTPPLELPTPRALAGYFNKQQVAHHLNVSKRTIDALMRARKLPFIKLTRKLVRFPKSDVDAYLARYHRVNAIGE